VKHYFALAILTAATAAMAASPEVPTTFSTKEEALKEAGLDIYESAKNAEIINDAVSNIENIPKSAYSGTWIEYNEKNEATQVIALSSPIGVKKSNNENIKYVFVKYSTNDLEKIRENIFSIFKDKQVGGEQLIFGIAINDQQNNISVRARKENLEVVKNIIDAQIEDSEIVTIDPQDGPVTLYGNIYGGTKIASAPPGLPNTAGGSVCTAGFNVIIDGIYQGIITAAHCLHQAPLSWTSVYFNNSPTGTNAQKGAYIGEYLADEWQHGIDAILFGNVSHVHTTSPQMYGSGNILRYVKDWYSPIINTNVCTYGGVNKWRCGTQKTLNSQQYVNGAVFTFSEATFCGSAGDSGGPVVNGNMNALGIYSGVLGQNQTGTCGASLGGATKPNSIYQPLAPYMAKYPNVKIRIN
jgi:streptogrisin C